MLDWHTVSFGHLWESILSASLSLAMMYVPLMLPDIRARVCALYPFSKLETLHKIGKNMSFEGVMIDRSNIFYVIVTSIKVCRSATSVAYLVS